MSGNAVTDNESNPAWRLFHIPYRVMIPEIYFHDPEWVSVHGRPTSGNKKVDKQLLNGTRTVWWTVDNIVEIYAMGSNVTFVNYTTDPILVYTDIQNHLQEWSRYLEYFDQSLNKLRTGIPIEDLVKFSSFADVIYPLTQNVDYTSLKPGTVLNKRTFIRRNRFKKHEEPKEEQKDTYQMDGSHVFMPGFLDRSPEPVNLTTEQRAEVLKDHLKEKHHQSFTDIFEKFMFSKMVGKESED